MKLDPNAPEVASVYAIIALISNATAAKQRLDELTKQAAIAGKAEADLKAAQDERTAAQRTLAQSRQVIEEFKVSSAKRNDELNKLEQSAKAKLDEASSREAQFKERSTLKERELAEREQKLAASERTIADRDARSRVTADRIASEENAWRQKAQRLNEHIAS